MTTHASTRLQIVLAALNLARIALELVAEDALSGTGNDGGGVGPEASTVRPPVAFERFDLELDLSEPAGLR